MFRAFGMWVPCTSGAAVVIKAASRSKAAETKRCTQKLADVDECAAVEQPVADDDCQTCVVRANGRCSEFRVPRDLELIRGVGAGAYGMVGAFKDVSTGQRLAVKKITNAFDDVIDGKRILREVRLLRSFDHRNIVKIVDMCPPAGPDFNDVYIAQELLDMDLAHVIRSKEVLNEEHFRWFTHEILCGVSYLHKLGVVHRDLKPANILVNKDCSVKICDFGLARGAIQKEGEEPLTPDMAGRTLTEYVVTRYYRAPEVVLSASHYGMPIDIWSVGCILVELMGRKPMFKGKDHLDQIRQILEVLGSPPQEDTEWLAPSPAAMKFVARFKRLPGRPWASLFPQASKELIAVIELMLRFDPSKRLSAAECLQHSFFEELREEDDAAGQAAEGAIDWSFDRFEPTKERLQNYLYAECARFHPSIVLRDGLPTLEARGITATVLNGDLGVAPHTLASL